MNPLSSDRNARDVAPTFAAPTDVWSLRNDEITVDWQRAANDSNVKPASDDDFWTRVVRTVSSWRERSRERHALAHLSAWQRRDIGLPSEAIDYEFNKHYWRA